MCRSIDEGGLRCAAHTRPAYQAATHGTAEWDQAATAYASTREGAARLAEELSDSDSEGNHERSAALLNAITSGQVTRLAAAEAHRRITEATTVEPPATYQTLRRSTETYLPDDSGDEFAYAFTSTSLQTAIGSARRTNHGRLHVTQPVAGEVLLLQDDDGSIIVEPAPAQRLRCECPEYRATYDCDHIRGTLDAIQSRVNQEDAADPHVSLAAAERARFTEEPTPIAAPITTQDDEVLYGDDTAAFQSVYREAKQRIRDGESPIGYMTSDATNGLGSPDGGRGFGIELEFSGGDRAAIGRELHAEGLTPTSRQVGYHSDRTVYTNHQGGWKFENDCTVSGEVISPLMHDTPETWENLSLVCDIITRNGGEASVRAGSHIHISSGDYRRSGADHGRLLQMFNDNEDLLYRLSSNPTRGTHRRLDGNSWSNPNNIEGADFTSLSSARYRATHGNAVNLEHCSGRRTDHVEYRMWDSTLDPATIQAQVKVSLAMTEAAHRETTYAPTGGTPVGTRRRHNREAHGEQRRITGDAWHADTQGFRSFVDTMFTRPQDKAQITGLFAATKWQWRSRRRRTA